VRGNKKSQQTCSPSAGLNEDIGCDGGLSST